MEYNKLYEKIIYNISKTIKRTLNEEIQSFDVTDYNDESDIIDAQTSDKLTMICPKTNGEFYDLVVQRIAKNPSNPYLLDIDTINVTDMSNLFFNGDRYSNQMQGYYYRYGVTPNNIKKLDLSNWNTSNVTSMSKMFKNCYLLEELDVSGFDTTNVQTMGEMFYECRRLTELDVSGFNTTNVKSMDGMFSGCSHLIELDVSGFDTTNVKYMSRMFYECKQLTELDVSGFDTSNVTSMNRMFAECEKLLKLDVSNFVTSNFSDAGFMEAFSYMFAGCKSLTKLDIYNFSIPSDLHDFKAIQGIFAGCDSLKLVTLPAKFIKQALNITLGLPMNIKILKRKKKIDNYLNEDE